MRYLAGGGTVNALYVGSNPTPRAKAALVPGSSPGGTAKDQAVVQRRTHWKRWLVTTRFD